MLILQQLMLLFRKMYLQKDNIKYVSSKLRIQLPSKLYLNGDGNTKQVEVQVSICDWRKAACICSSEAKSAHSVVSQAFHTHTATRVRATLACLLHLKKRVCVHLRPHTRAQRHLNSKCGQMHPCSQYSLRIQRIIFSSTGKWQRTC